MLPLEIEVDWKLLAVAGVIVAGVLWYQRKVAGEIADAVKSGTLDPTSQKNVAYQGAVAVYQAVTGSDQSPGADLYDLFNKPQEVPGWIGDVYVGLERDAATGLLVTKGTADMARTAGNTVGFDVYQQKTGGGGLWGGIGGEGWIDF